MKHLITPRQVAQAIGVSESSLKRWCDRGLLNTVRTPGGHRRLEVPDVLRFLRESGHQVVRPALLGLPSNASTSPTIPDRAADQMKTALLEGDAERSRRIAFDLYLSGKSVSHICDDVIAEAMHAIGASWECGEAEVYQERLACNLCMRVLAELRSALPPAPEGAPVAIGGTPECDPYTLPTTMSELVLRQNGWRAQSLGARLPFDTLLAAIRHVKPQLFWLSVSHLEDAQEFLEGYRAFYEQAAPDMAIVVGGRELSEKIRRRMEYTAFCDNMQHLESFARTLGRSIIHSSDDDSALAQA